MKRIWITSILGLIAACLTGCSNGGSAIYAAAPGTEAGTSYTVPSAGRYTLFKVTEWTQEGRPVHSQEMASYQLSPGDKLGFDWVTDTAKMYDPNAHINLQAYAGPHRVELGGINSPSERYFWADAGGWSSYWSMQPGRDAGRKLATMY